LNAALTLSNKSGKQFEKLWSSRFQTGKLQSREGEAVCWSVLCFEFINDKTEFHLSLVWVHHNHLYLVSCLRIKSSVVCGTAAFFQVGGGSKKYVPVQRRLLNACTLWIVISVSFFPNKWKFWRRDTVK